MPSIAHFVRESCGFQLVAVEQPTQQPLPTDWPDLTRDRLGWRLAKLRQRHIAQRPVWAKPIVINDIILNNVVEMQGHRI